MMIDYRNILINRFDERMLGIYVNISTENLDFSKSKIQLNSPNLTQF